MVAEEFFTIVNKNGEEIQLKNNAKGKEVFAETYEPNGWKVLEKEPDYDPAEDLKRQKAKEAEEAKKAAEENKDK